MPTFTVAEKNALAIISSQFAMLLSQLLSLQVIAGNNALRVSRYSTLALMKAEPNYEAVRLWILLGKNAAGDGILSGEYYYDPTSTATPNDNSIVQLTSTATGRLIKFI